MKRIISMLLSLALIMPICATSVSAIQLEESKPELPPGVVLMEGERWIPAEEGIMLFGDDDEVGPAGFTFRGTIVGNYTLDIAIGSTIEGLLVLGISSIIFGGLTIPQFAVNLYNIASPILSFYSTPKEELGDYERMVFTCDDPYAFCGFAYPYINYYYITYFATLRDVNGNRTKIIAAVKDTYEYALLP